MDINTNLIAEVFTIILGIFAFYNVVTKPIKDCIIDLKEEIKVMNKDNTEIHKDIVRIESSVKSAHKRIDNITN